MDKGDKRRCKQPAAPSNSIIAKYRHDDDDDEDDSADQWRKYRQERNLSVYHDRSERQSNPPIDTTMGYHCSADVSRFRKHHVSSSSACRTKYQIPSVPEEAYRASRKNHGTLRALRCYPNNFTVVRKPRYNDDEDVSVDDNPEEETGEEIVDVENENVSEYSDKDYEEQEADDEVDEESDVLESEVEKLEAQRKSRVDPPKMRIRKTSIIEPSHCYHEQKISTEKHPQRCCHITGERGDAEVPTEDDEEHHDLCEGRTCSTKKTNWSYHVHQDKESRIIPRNFVEKCSSFNKAVSGSGHQNRRPRTTKPEVESSIILAQMHHGPVCKNRCSKCVALTGQKPKTTSSRNASCRLPGTRHFTRIPIGDEYFEDPEATISYETKPRRSKESKSADYDRREECRTLDAEIGSIYKSCRTKNPRDLSNGHGERTRHSARINNRHEPLPPSKNENRYWK